MTQDTILRSVRVGGAGSVDPLTARMRLATALATADLRPSGLAPAALLIVRRLEDPLPGGLALDGPPAIPAAWQRACTSVLDRVLAEAARPAAGAVPAGANAVLFVDRAELLACLARDALDGTAPARWWWRSALARAAGAREAAAQACLAAPRHVPAAVELLATWSLAPAFARALSASVVAELSRRVAGAFALPAIGGEDGAATGRGRPASTERRRREAPAPRAPWHELVPEARDPTLDNAGRLFVGLALALRRAPALARTPAFAQAARAWQQGAARREPVLPDRPAIDRGREEGRAPAASRAGGAPAPVARRTADRRGAGADAAPREPPPTDPDAGGSSPRPASGADARTAPAPVAGAPRAAPRAGKPAAPAPATAAAMTPPPRPAVAGRAQPDVSPPRPPPAAPPPAATSPAADGGRDARPSGPIAAPSNRADPAPAAPSRPSVRPPDRAPLDEPGIRPPVATGLGGLFYLLNLALQLDLYRDFTRPRDPCIGLDPWDLVELLGLRLLGERPADPVWELLAALAVRPAGARPGESFRPPAAWRVPPAWLEPLDHGGTWRWSAAAGVLRVRHPAGFDAIAVPRTAAPPAAQLRRELAHLPRAARPRAAVRAGLPREPAPPLARWMARLAAYSEARLRTVLDLDRDAGEPADEVLIRRRARIFVSATHVDVVLKLAELPIHVRIAGLDRTPGWIPATGRFVAFHFE